MLYSWSRSSQERVNFLFPRTRRNPQDVSQPRAVSVHRPYTVLFQKVFLFLFFFYIYIYIYFSVFSYFMRVHETVRHHVIRIISTFILIKPLQNFSYIVQHDYYSTFPQTLFRITLRQTNCLFISPETIVRFGTFIVQQTHRSSE